MKNNIYLITKILNVFSIQNNFLYYTIILSLSFIEYHYKIK